MVLEIMKCLSDNTRLRILTLIYYRKSPICVGDVVDSLDLPQYAISRHLKRVQGFGLLESFKKTQYTYYYINENTFNRYPFLKELLEINLDEMEECKLDIQRMENIK